MTITELIKNINSIENDYAVVFAQKIDGEFLRDSKIVVLEIDEESEEDLSKTAKLQYPEFDYFLELFLIKELIDDLTENFDNVNQVVTRVIHYAKYDA